MEVNHLDPGGLVVPPTCFQLPRARRFAEAVGNGRLAYVAIVECRQRASSTDGRCDEIVVIEVEIERPQVLANDIRRTERIAVRFVAADDWYPEVLALRADFPRVPHLNLGDEELPRSLCLYDQPWSQIALRWTPTSCVERIRYWLAETAKGTLHQADQPLEPFIFGSGITIVLPADLFSDNEKQSHEELRVGWVMNPKEGGRVLLADRGTGGGDAPFLALSVTAPAQTHGAIRHRPRTLKELDDLLQTAGFSLLTFLRQRLLEWNSEELLAKHLLIVVAFPLMRDGRIMVEANDLWAFLLASTIADVGSAIGIWEALSGTKRMGLVLHGVAGADGEAVPLDVLNPQFALTRAKAAAASGHAPDARRVVAVGAGALGSQVIRTLAQAGFGTWTILDEDVLLPHNIARHALGGNWVGVPKAKALALEIDQFYAASVETASIDADVLRPRAKDQEINGAFNAAELILDFSASIPVARHLAQSEHGAARRASLFLNPQGSDLVLLLEDAARDVPLDCLEMQYYRAVSSISELASHLQSPTGRIRYARSCRDVTATIPNHLVALHSAIGANAIRKGATAESPTIQIWRADSESGAVVRLAFDVTPVRRQTNGDWTLVVDSHVTKRLNELRLSKLPNETGGVLIGSYDLARRTVYVVDTVPSPPDSAEWPTLYIRGSNGLFGEVERIQQSTDGQLEYVGEWHSHPDGCPCHPSDDDVIVFSWLTENMSDAGLPALMAIAGQGGKAEWYLGQMLRSGGLEFGL